MAFCSNCGSELVNGSNYCKNCGIAITINKKELIAKENKFPSVLWLLPILFGFVGGIVAAFISNIAYKASWWKLFVIGICITLLWIFVWMAIVGGFIEFLKTKM
jgi:hypothetical protein